jgi:hypothetical protein
MKKLFILGAFLVSAFGVTGYAATDSMKMSGNNAAVNSYDSSNRSTWGYANNNNDSSYRGTYNMSGTSYASNNAYVASPAVAGDCGCPADKACGECYCMYVHYQPRYYTTKRCIEEQYTCPKKCCRYVPQYYEVQRCRYVPEYYTETMCRQVPEYYEVQECKTCKKVICEPQVEYVPTYYWKHECAPTNCQTQCNN